MKITLAVYAAPYSSQASASAYQYAKAALELGHSLYRIFFYYDGVHNASALCIPPQDEIDIQQCWQNLTEKYQLDVVVCVSSALKRGILNKIEADRYDKPCHSMSEEMELSGLGQLVDAGIESDRLISFGA